MDLRIKLRSWFKWQFDVLDDNERVAFIDLKLFKEGAEMEIGGEPFRIYREGWVSGHFVLEAFRQEIARADKPSAFRRRFVVSFAGRRFILEAANPVGRTFVLHEEPKDGIGVEVGRVAPVKWFKRDAVASFDEDLPVAFDVFVIGLVLVMWKRASDASSS